MLVNVKDSLEQLQVSSCGDISDDGVKSLSSLTELHYLLLYDLPEVTNKEDCTSHLKKYLKKCKIDFPYAQAGENTTNK